MWHLHLEPDVAQLICLDMGRAWSTVAQRVLGASLIYTIRLAEMMEQYKKKVKENAVSGGDEEGREQGSLYYCRDRPLNVRIPPDHLTKQGGSRGRSFWAPFTSVDIQAATDEEGAYALTGHSAKKSSAVGPTASFQHRCAGSRPRCAPTGPGRRAT